MFDDLQHPTEGRLAGSGGRCGLVASTPVQSHQQVPMSTNDKPTSRQSSRSKAKATRVAAPPPRRSPVLLATFGAVAAGAILVVILVMANGSSKGDPSTALVAPAFQTPTALADGRSLGTATAPIALDVWADFQCPYCGQFSEQIESLIVPLYVQPGHARLTFHDYAFIGQEFA